MKDTSFEILSSKIKQNSTREYFKEVISSYHNENHRASIVTGPTTNYRTLG